jgi:hypothetical protein
VGIKAAVKVTVMPTNTEHLCTLCRPGSIGRLESLWRKGYVGLGNVMREVELIASHHKAFKVGPGVSLAKAGDVS